MMIKEFLDQFPYILVGIEVLYFAGVFFLAAKIIIDTKTTSKTLAYLMLIVFLPFVGIIIYFVFGVNYRKNKFYTFKIEGNEEVFQKILKFVKETHYTTLNSRKDELDHFITTINFLYHSGYSPLTQENEVEVLVNGEEKFSKVFEVIRKAKHHIHLEYYIYENDDIGNKLADLLVLKAKDGVVVRFLYDDMGSGKIGKKLLNRLKEAGVEVSPVNKITFRVFANRVNYRDHRKIIIVDGKEVFTGGINVSDKYINPNSKQYWRDIHLYIKGNGAFYFQFLFLSNLSAKEKVYIVTPYFIPVETVLNAIKQVALSGLDVRLMVPRSGDSVIVNAAAYSYYEELLENNVRIFFYKKGFIHAKTMVIDDNFSCVGTANMDVRSQELNFEVNTLIFDKEVNQKLQNVFLADIDDCDEIILNEWKKRPKHKVFFEHLARLLSPLI
ncbi:putative cardiolipin synthase YwiE [compost metagenome]